VRAWRFAGRHDCEPDDREYRTQAVSHSITPRRPTPRLSGPASHRGRSNDKKPPAWLSSAEARG
jgi:hypothetical protein